MFSTLHPHHIAQTLCSASNLLRGRRTLFTLPDLSSLSPFSESNKNPDTQTYHERKIFPYVPETPSSAELDQNITGSYKQSQLYDIVADVGSYPHFVPFCTGSQIISSSKERQPIESLRANTIMEAELEVGFLTFKESYVSKVTCKPFESVEVCLVIGMLWKDVIYLICTGCSIFFDSAV